MRRNINLLPAGITMVETNDVVDPEFVPSTSQIDEILKDIFSVDPDSGLPRGDLAYYLSPDGNPTVKAWLENNLLKPRAARVGSSVEGVTDDMLNEYSRGKDESVSDYAARLRSIYDTATAEIEKLKNAGNE